MAQGNNIQNIYSDDWKVELEVDARNMQFLVAECHELAAKALIDADNGNQKQTIDKLHKLVDRTLRLKRICACA